MEQSLAAAYKFLKDCYVVWNVMLFDGLMFTVELILCCLPRCEFPIFITIVVILVTLVYTVWWGWVFETPFNYSCGKDINIKHLFEILSFKCVV